ncbi:AAA family ATPase [Natrialba sp. PRR66]|uniref:Cdc6/Cdc18 family protein n=1 Tax=Natrialba sp. PRR66 TaxID=3098146 RepID=UPI002B1D44CE|nr:AAA family ATPase [Natrialba sp. PRR66]
MIVHRNSEINTLSSIFESVTNGRQTSGAFIYGPPGSGKTCAANVLLNEIPATTVTKNGTSGEPIETAYIDCYNGKSRRDVYQNLLETLGEGPAQTRPSAATDQLRRQILDAIDGHLIVVLDEADQIGEKDVLKELYEMTGVALLPIVTKSHQLFADAEDRLDSRLTALTPIPFRSYDESTLVKILQARANVGLEHGVVEREHLQIIAERSRNDQGARFRFSKTQFSMLDQKGPAR